MYQIQDIHQRPEDHGSRFTRAFILVYCFLLFLPRTILNFAITLGEPFAIDFHLRHSAWIGLYQEHVQLLEHRFRFNTISKSERG
jgi:hypothetical protein